MRLMRRIFVVYSLSAVLLVCAAAALVHVPAQGRDGRTPVRNAAWIGHQWVGTPQSRTAISTLCAVLRTHDIGTVFVHVGPADAAGRIVDGRAPYAGRFVDAFHTNCPGVQALAWIGQLLPSWDGLLDLDSASVRAGLVSTAARFGALGFDGIQYDLEPVPDGDAAFLDLLRRTRTVLGRKQLAVATPALLPANGLPPLAHLRLPLTPWSAPYYASVAALADDLAPMLYETSLRTANSYTQFVAEQVIDLARLLPNARILPGLPVFAGSDSIFNDRVENLSSGLAGLTLAFHAGTLPPSLAGVAIYPLWSMTPMDWQTLDHWLGTAR